MARQGRRPRHRGPADGRDVDRQGRGRDALARRGPRRVARRPARRSHRSRRRAHRAGTGEGAAASEQKSEATQEGSGAGAKGKGSRLAPLAGSSVRPGGPCPGRSSHRPRARIPRDAPARARIRHRSRNRRRQWTRRPHSATGSGCRDQPGAEGAGRIGPRRRSEPPAAHRDRGDPHSRRAPRERAARQRVEAQHPAFRVRRGSRHHRAGAPAQAPQLEARRRARRVTRTCRSSAWR